MKEFKTGASIIGTGFRPRPKLYGSVSGLPNVSGIYGLGPCGVSATRTVEGSLFLMFCIAFGMV